MASLLDLRPNRELLNSNFDHYQLSLDRVPMYETPLDDGIDVAKPPESTFSSHHAKLFGLHNHLIADPWNNDSVYFCDTHWNIGRVQIGKTGKPQVQDSLFIVPHAADLRIKPVRFNVSLGFPSKNLAVVCNGSDHLYLLETADRNSSDKWKTLFDMSVPVSAQAGALVDCTLWLEGELRRVECLLASVEEVEGETKEKHRSPWVMQMHWLSLSTVDGIKWNHERTRRLEGTKPFDSACLERGGKEIHIVGPHMYRMVEDSLKPVEVIEDGWEVVECEGMDSSPLYTWSQTASDLTVHLTLPDTSLTKANLSVDISGTRLELAIKNGLELLKGDFSARVDVDACTWTLDGRRLEISLEKVEAEMWPSVIVGDSRGQLVMTPEQLQAVHERLAHLTSEDWNPGPDKGQKPYNTQMLEECDALDGDGVILTCIDGETHTVTHKVVANNQYLFSVQTDPNLSPAICLRHDVDGFLWQVNSSSEKVRSTECPWQHVGVLNAFGYVLASKTQRRFCTCTPDMSVAVVADGHRHVFLYRQNVSVLSPLRNRKTGQQISSVAKQQVLALDCQPDTILGLVVSNSKIFVATDQKIFVYVIKADE
ncbi:nudc domain-containing protein 1 [Plakobranchus ocellatus]|uniref:NudC domain-containing protein 1 n=1 Tax=Plakobranchus ocellatus TaxID=259542 RepID=A0AAV4DH52_9GAST|nr:nudc domain-containing protein 1 [Plakobranchus ocellatus]